MTVREILTYPDPRLRPQASEITVFDAELRQLADDMLETMYSAGGIGLAAPQVNVSRRLVVVDLGQEAKEPEVLVNPAYRVLEQAEPVMIAEGCLSVPRLRVEIERYSSIEFSWQDLDGTPHTEKPESELRCICLQHELDHLDGRLIVDYLSRMQRERYKRLLDKPQGEDMQVRAAKSGVKSSGKMADSLQPNARANEIYARIRKQRGRDEYERKVTA